MLNTTIFCSFLVFCGVSVIYAHRASRQIVSDFEPLKPRLIPRFGMRSDYTPEGWRNRNRALLFQALAVGALLLWVITLADPSR